MKFSTFAMNSKYLILLSFCVLLFVREIRSKSEPLNEATTKAMLGALKSLLNVYASFNNHLAASNYNDLDRKPTATLNEFKSWAKACIDFAIYKCETAKVYENAESKKTLKNAINAYFTEATNLVGQDKMPIKSNLEKELKRLG